MNRATCYRQNFIGIFDYTCYTEFTEFNIYPWNNGDPNVSDFDSILLNRVNYMLDQSGLTLNQCYSDSVLSEWYVDLIIDGQQIIKEPFYTGRGITDSPSDIQWLSALIQYLPQLTGYGYAYFLNGSNLTITNLSCLQEMVGEEGENVVNSVLLNIGINININCNQ
jgi:hypothetical protein